MWLLTEAEIVRETYIEQSNIKTYVPALDTHKITLALLIKRIETLGNENFKLKVDESSNGIWEKLIEIQKDYSESLNSVLIKDL